MTPRLNKFAYGEEDAQKILDSSKKKLIRRDISQEVMKGQVRREGGDPRIVPRYGPAGIGKKLKTNDPEMKAMYDALPDNMTNKIYIKGDTHSLMRDGAHAAAVMSRKDDPKLEKLTPGGRKALNATLYGHELDEVRHMSKQSTPQTTLGESLGHHSVAQILGSESNRMTTASDPATKSATKLLGQVRGITGEKNIYNNILALRDKDGIPRFKYGHQKVNRSHRKALYKKERGINAEPGQVYELNESGRKRTAEARRLNIKRRQAGIEDGGFKRLYSKKSSKEKKFERKEKLRKLVQGGQEKLKNVMSRLRF